MNVLEQATIHAAQTYAEANGYSPDDRIAVGLVLAGMAIAASCSGEVRTAILRDYLAQNPAAVDPMRRWARFLEEAAR